MNQKSEAKDAASALIRKLETVEDFRQLHSAVCEFIIAMEERIYVLGDDDLIELAAAAAYRHGKPVWVGLSLFARAMELQESEPRQDHVNGEQISRERSPFAGDTK
jgi:hypothetical protein